jgi:hypothetical protein
VADEQTTPSDTPNSPPTDAPVIDAPAADTPSDDAPPADQPPADADTSVLGGDVAKDDDTPPADDADEPAGPPEKYELALEGIELDPEAVEAAEPVFRELNLSNEQANKLMPVAKEFAERTAERTLAQIVEAGAAQKKEWLDAFKADPEIGGAKSDETEHLAAKGLDALGYPQGHDFRKALTETGFGNHPEMIRVFRKIGEMVGEDGFVRPDGAKQSDQPTESRWYGKKGD